MNTNPGYIHPTASCDGAALGEGTTVGAFTFIANSARLGERCWVGRHCGIEAEVTVGACVVIEDGVHLPAGTLVEDDVVIRVHASFASARGDAGAMPREEPTRLGRGCVIGAGAVVRRGLTIGEGAVVEAGAVVVQAVQPHAIMSGNPAKVSGFAGLEKVSTSSAKRGEAQVVESRVRGVRRHAIPFITDPRGNLTVGEFERTVPFRPKRYFITFDVPSEHLRGEHAHRRCDQFLVCVRGSCAVVVDDGTNREEFILDRPTVGLHVPPMVWAIEYRHSADSTLLVFASEFYDPDDYIRDYREFLELVRDGRA